MTSAHQDNTAFEDAPLVLGAASSSIVMTLAYFSLFQHPLREEELLTYAHFYSVSREAGQAAIHALLDQGILESHEGLLCLHGDGSMVGIRAERVARAIPWQKQAARSIRVLSHLPFLRGLFISGSLSKGTQDPDGDIDFLLLTAPNRLWTARFFSSILLKFLPRARKRNFCLNYYLPEDRLAVPDRTLFSATEVAFLKPVLNEQVCAKFFEQNGWVGTFYPNWEPPRGPAQALPASGLQRLVEWPLAGFLGDLFESRISHWYLNRMTRSMGYLPLGKSAADVRLSPRELKGHTNGLHERVRQGWSERMNLLEADLGIRLVRWPWATTLASWHSMHRPVHHVRAEDQASHPVLPLKITGRWLLPTR